MNNQLLFQQHKCCVIIPTYNNGRTLKRMVESVLEHCRDVIVVNDGATDETSIILEEFDDQIHLLTHERNLGKGKAIRNGFTKAVDLGFEFAITIDSDGQHFAENLPDLLQESVAHPKAVIMGARNMDQDGIPSKSSFGNKFSNFWFYFETGIKLPDTQTGFRLYPLSSISRRKYFTSKFEFEIEVIVKMAWMFVPFRTVPVKVSYDPDERVSHFRPFRDFTRISILNTYLVILTLIWHFHARMIRKVWKKGLWNTFKEQWTNKGETNLRKSVAIGFGIFMGIIPIWGFQTLVAAAMAKLLKLNIVLTLVSSNISIPPMIPLILYCSVICGSIALNQPAAIHFNSEIELAQIYLNLKQYVIGAFIFAIIAGVLSFSVTFFLLQLFRKTQNLDTSI